MSIQPKYPKVLKPKHLRDQQTNASNKTISHAEIISLANITNGTIPEKHKVLNKLLSKQIHDTPTKTRKSMRSLSPTTPPSRTPTKDRPHVSPQKYGKVQVIHHGSHLLIPEIQKRKLFDRAQAQRTQMRVLVIQLKQKIKVLEKQNFILKEQNQVLEKQICQSKKIVNLFNLKFNEVESMKQNINRPDFKTSNQQHGHIQARIENLESKKTRQSLIESKWAQIGAYGVLHNFEGNIPTFSNLFSKKVTPKDEIAGKQNCFQFKSDKFKLNSTFCVEKQIISLSALQSDKVNRLPNERSQSSIKGRLSDNLLTFRIKPVQSEIRNIYPKDVYTSVEDMEDLFIGQKFMKTGEYELFDKDKKTEF